MPVSPHSSFRLPWIGIWIDAWRVLRRWFNGATWSARVLGLSHFAADDEHGLVLVQIDGLSKRSLEKALAKNMPTLRRFIGREGYQLHDVYSGLPSTTPAAQAELFYGARTAVPAFVFVDRATGQAVKMISSDVAAKVEKQISLQGRGLLTEGSAIRTSTPAAPPNHTSAPRRSDGTACFVRAI